jgi:membrane associated rhomboid family serine protease
LLGLGLVALLVALHLALLALAGAQPLAPTRYLVLGAARSLPLLEDHGWYRLWASALFHGSWVHLALNAFGILIFSAFVERGLGRRQTAVFLVLAVGLSSLVSAALSDQPVAGASTLMLALSGAAAGLALGQLLRRGPDAGGLIHLAVLAGLLVISVLRHDQMDAPGHVTAGLFGLVFVGLAPFTLRRLPQGVLSGLALGALLLTLGCLRLAAETLVNPPGPPETILGSLDAPAPRLPSGRGWKLGTFDNSSGCTALPPGTGADEVLRRGDLLCLTDAFFNAVFFGPATAAATTSLWKEAALRTLGSKPGAFAEMAIHFRVRGDGTALGLSVFRPQEAAYLPMFLALSEFKGDYRYLEITPRSE